MSVKVARQIAKRKRKIERRLERAIRQGRVTPMLAATNIHFELSERVHAIPHGGIGAIFRLIHRLGLVERLNNAVKVLKQHRPYHESDHILNIAFNALCGGRTLDDIELRRNDEVFLNALGAASIPDPTTAGDFCRRFDPSDIEALQDAINQTRLEVWKQQPPEFFQQTAQIDADGTFVTNDSQCKEGMDFTYKKKFGYHPLLVSLANTQEPLFLLNRSGNRKSFEGVVPLFDKAILLCFQAGFQKVLLRGDTDFSSITSEYDRWDDMGVKFVFGYKAFKTLEEYCDQLRDEEFQELVRRTERELKTEPRTRPKNIKEQRIKQRKYKNIRLESEDVVEFEYQPGSCDRKYWIVALRKNLSVEKGEDVLFDEYRYYFYITNDDCLNEEETVFTANKRCNQENLIAQLGGGVRALHAPVNTLNANWAYMVMASLAWSLKAWFGLLLPAKGRWKEKHQREKEQVIRMEFRTFLNRFMQLPTQIVKTGRKLVYRLLAWNPWQEIFFRLVNRLHE